MCRCGCTAFLGGGSFSAPFHLLSLHSGGDEGDYDPTHRGEARAVLKKPKVSLLSSYHCNWESKTNHFTSYSEIKVKEEKKPTVIELANQVKIVIV